jgi:hypothetical protein
MIDIPCSILFGWKALNIDFQQKIVSYAHLYSHTSVKTLVHWFQIIRAQTFQMFDDEASTTIFSNASSFNKVAQYPTKNIHSPIVLVYGGIDSLVEYILSYSYLMCSIDVIMSQLPSHCIAKKVENYEHLDLIWGKDVDEVVFPHVLESLTKYAEKVELEQESKSPADLDQSKRPSSQQSLENEPEKLGQKHTTFESTSPELPPAISIEKNPRRVVKEVRWVSDVASVTSSVDSMDSESIRSMEMPSSKGTSARKKDNGAPAKYQVRTGRRSRLLE